MLTASSIVNTDQANEQRNRIIEFEKQDDINVLLPKSEEDYQLVVNRVAPFQETKNILDGDCSQFLYDDGNYVAFKVDSSKLELIDGIYFFEAKAGKKNIKSCFIVLNY